jgi:hypothetical protein
MLHSLLIRFMVALIIYTLLQGCTSQSSDTFQTTQSSQACVTSLPDPTIVGLPPFLKKVSPGPESVTKL